jgi:hypothetical protein
MTNNIVERLRESADGWKFEADNAGQTDGRLRRRVRKLEDAGR